MTTVGFTRTRPGGITPPPPKSTTVQTGLDINPLHFPGHFWNALKGIFGPSGIAPGGAIGPPAYVAPGSGNPADAFGAAGSLYQTVDQAVTSTTDFLKLAAWIMHPVNWLRMVEFVTGISMIYFGLRNTFKGRGGSTGRFYAERQRTARTRERSKQATEKTRHETERTRRARESTKRAREKTKQEFERTRRKENRGRSNR